MTITGLSGFASIRTRPGKPTQVTRDIAAGCAIVGLLILGIATLAWYVVLPAALVLLVLGMWGTRR